MIPCAGTRQDGDLRKGAPLSYTDNGDGTISDSNTELQWEKLSMDGDALHDVGNHYSFASGLDKIANLNAAAFAGHTDWRLPNVRELESITDYGRIGGNGPTTSPAFDNNCTPGCTVLDCSCTGRDFYWSSTTRVDMPTLAWAVSGGFGNISAGGKDVAGYVRAVRGGEACVDLDCRASISGFECCRW